MGISGKKTKTETKPVYSKEIEGAYGASNNTYNQGAANANELSGQFSDLVPDLLNKYRTGNSAVNAGTQYVADTAGGKYLGENPFLEGIIGTTRDNVADEVNASIGLRGTTGGSGHSNILAKQLSDMESGLRYQDYGAERDRMGQAASLAPSLAAAEQIPLAAAMDAASQSVNLPWIGANNLASNTGGLLGQYTNSTQQQSGGLLGNLLGAGLAGWASGGFGT